MSLWVMYIVLIYRDTSQAFRVSLQEEHRPSSQPTSPFRHPRSIGGVVETDDFDRHCRHDVRRLAAYEEASFFQVPSLQQSWRKVVFQGETVHFHDCFRGV